MRCAPARVSSRVGLDFVGGGISDNKNRRGLNTSALFHQMSFGILDSRLQQDHFNCCG
jgi:hypothetical protein